MNDSSISVPLVDLDWQHRVIADEVMAGIAGVLQHKGFVLGPETVAFEREFAEYCGVGHVLGVGNGTDALELALRGLGVGPGDDVIVPTNTFVATAEAVVRVGANVVLVDNDENFLIDPESVRQRLTPRTRAIMAVHLYGQAAPVEILRQIAGPDVVIIEDAAQAQGARRLGRRAGSLGDAAGTSFYPGKNLGAYGDAGAVMTADDHVAARIARLRNHGGVQRYEHLDVGVNSRLDSMQAVVLSAKLARLDEWNTLRREAADRYAAMLAEIPGIVVPRVAAGNEHVWHLYVVRVAERDAVLAHLAKAGVSAGIHYPSPIHLLPAFEYLGYSAGDFPTAERQAAELLSIPIFPGITVVQQVRVVDALAQAVSALAHRDPVTV
jgi:dTDP-4-amino-4,6-dideoxygalactose transaminase